MTTGKGGADLSLGEMTGEKGATARSSWPFGGDQVMLATSEAPDREKAAVRWFFFHCVDHGFSLRRAGDLVGYSPTVLYRLCKNDYPAKDRNKVLAAIEAYRRTFEQSQGPEHAEFVMTDTAQKIWTHADLAREYHTIAFVYGDSQIGKTWALRAYARANNHGLTKYFRMPSSAGIQLMMQELAMACAFSPDGPYSTLRKRVLHALDENTVVIADEIHQAFVSYHKQARLSCLEVLREIQDRTSCGMVLAGTNTARDEIHSGTYSKLLQQLDRRGIFKLQLPDQATRRDQAQIAKALAGLPPADGDAAELVKQIVRDSGLKAYTTYLKAARKLAENRKEGLNWGHFVQAHDIVAKMSVQSKW
jgi:DNA transposition AAA+ family ATPase